MGTEVAVSFTTLRAQLESEKSTLYKIDESIKKIVQSPRFSDRFNKSSTEFGRGGFRGGPRNSFPENGTPQRTDELFGKRKQETKTAFSRLSGRGNNSDGEDEPNNKRSRVHSAVSRELPSRAAVLRAQGGDEQARTRNKRIFGALLGTLQKFKQEEIGLQTKEDKKAQVERKIEEQARQQKEKEQLERKTLFAERDSKKAIIKSLEAKMSRVQEFERWTHSQKHLGNFILTKTKPPIYWLPKKMSDSAREKLKSSKSYHEKYMQQKREELTEELQRIEQRCLRRPGGGGVTTGHIGRGADHAAPRSQTEGGEGEAEGNCRRDKFATGGERGAPGDSEGEGEESHLSDKTEEKMETDTAQEDSNINSAVANNLHEVNITLHEADNTLYEANNTLNEANNALYEDNNDMYETNNTSHDVNITLHEAEETTPETDYSRNETQNIAKNHHPVTNHDDLPEENNDEQ